MTDGQKKQENEITIVIDGIEIKTAPGKTVLDAARDAGIYIPYLCYHPGMEPYAACRMCLVEVENGRGFPASCTLPVADGMIVNNETQKVRDLRKEIMEMLIADHPQGCLTCHRVDLCGPQDICLRHVSVNDRCVSCPKNERCELKDTVRYMEMDLESPLEYKYRDLQVDTGDPFYDRDYNLCIVCARCVRVCEEVRGDNAITLIERGGQALVGTSIGSSLLESGCEFCGACLDVCPVGALVESSHKWEKPERVERTVCPLCPVGCQLNLEVGRFEKVIRSIPELNSPANRGQACFKGKFGLEFVNHKERIRRPLIRHNGVLEEVSWDDAIAFISKRLSYYKDGSFAMLTAPDSTNEEQYLAQKFCRLVMGTNNVDQISNTSPNLVEPLSEILGTRSGTNSLWELENSECVVVFAANVTEEHNVVALPIKRAIKNGGKLIVIDPRETEITRHSNLWLKIKPGSELLLLGAILKVIIDRDLADIEWIDKNCMGLPELKTSLDLLDINYVVSKSGVDISQIEKAAIAIASCKSSSIVYGLDNIEPSLQSDCVRSLVNLSLITGNLGGRSNGLYPLRRGANEQGAWDMGCVPHLLPGYIPVGDSERRKIIEEIWDGKCPENVGLSISDIKTAEREGKVKAMFIVGAGLNSTEKDVEPLLSSMDHLEFLVVQDTFLGEFSNKADVVLPRATFAEKSGSFTNLERRIQLIKPVIYPKNSSAKSELWFICELAKSMGYKGFEFSSAHEVMGEISKVVDIYGGISLERLESEARRVFRPDPSNPAPTQVLYSGKEYKGIQWPCYDAKSRGVDILFQEGFSDPKARISALDFTRYHELSSAESPFIFLPGRVLLQSEREMEVEYGINNHIKRQEIIEIHPADAQPLGVRGGDTIRVLSHGSILTGIALLSESQHKGVISSTSLFGQLMTELNENPDPYVMARVPKLITMSANVEKVI
ncbi:MAG: hypothetical protein CL891_05495 [Dehalococcoidia bacterium]|nr:hypothetical protein [Dehalococcoidia bacterium]